MKTHSLLAATAATVALCSCAAPSGIGKDIQHQVVTPESSSVCIRQQCKVEVRVTDDCRVAAYPYYLIMVGKAPVTVTWEISSNATFAGDGVFFKDAAGKKVFRRAERPEAEKQVVFTNDMSHGIFHYGIRVAVKGRECPVLDPTGVNDMVTGGGPGP